MLNVVAVPVLSAPAVGPSLPVGEITEFVSTLYQHERSDFPEYRAAVVALSMLLVSFDTRELANYTGYPVALVRSVDAHLRASGFLSDARRLDHILNDPDGGKLLMAWAVVGAGFSRCARDGKFYITAEGRRRVRKLSITLLRMQHSESTGDARR